MQKYKGKEGKQRVNIGVDPFNDKLDLEGCLGFTKPIDKNVMEDDKRYNDKKPGWGSGRETQFNNVNKYLEKHIPDLTRDDETVYVNVEEIK